MTPARSLNWSAVVGVSFLLQSRVFTDVPSFLLISHPEWRLSCPSNMRLFGCSNAIRLLSVLSFFSISSGAVLEQRASGDSVVCGNLEQKCTPKDGPSYCCPKENMVSSPLYMFLLRGRLMLELYKSAGQ